MHSAQPGKSSHHWGGTYVSLTSMARLQLFIWHNYLEWHGLMTKSGGKNGKHAAATDASNISAVSYLAMQVFKHMHGPLFQDHPDATAIFHTKQFALLTSNAFVCLLTSIPKTIPTGLELAQKESEWFKQLLLVSRQKFWKFWEARVNLDRNQ